MNINKEKTPYNNKGEPHGYWEVYHLNSNLFYKGNFINGKQSGYWEWYYDNGELMNKIYFIL